MKTLVDLSILAYHSVINLLAFTYADKLYDYGYIFCADSDTSIRKQHVPLYKATRGLCSVQQLQLRTQAKQWCMTAQKRYHCALIDGLEADDVIALLFQPGDFCMSTDKDNLGIPGIKLVDMFGIEWGFPRVQKKVSFNISTPMRFCAYQLVYGDATDGIPRLTASEDRRTGPWLFSMMKPLTAAIDLLPKRNVERNLNCLVVPTPLYLNVNPVDYVMDRYKGEL